MDKAGFIKLGFYLHVHGQFLCQRQCAEHGREGNDESEARHCVCPMSTPRYLRGYQVLEINRGDGLGTEESCSTMG